MASTLKVENRYSWLYTDDHELRKKLYLSLRCRPKDYIHSTAYKQGRWDGWVSFFDRASGKFLTGLLPEITAALRLLKIPYQIADQRKPISWLYKPEDITPQFLHKWSPEGEEVFDLYDYQVDYIRQTLKFGRGLVVSPTASGKTNVLIGIMKCMPPKTPILFMTKNAGLVDQNYQEMKKWGIQDLGRYYGGYKEPNYVMCVTAHQKTMQGLSKLLPRFKAVIVDEVHECMSDIPVAAYQKMESANIRLGISATPFKFAGKDKEHKFKVKGYFGGVFKTTTTESGYLTTKELQDREILSRSQCTFYPITEPKTIAYEPYMDAVTLGISENIHFHQIVTRLARSLEGRTLVLVERIDQGNFLKQLMPEAHWLSGKDSLENRAEVFRDLKKGEKVIAICMRHIITAGINVFLHNLINASGGQAEHSVVQQMGRGLRCAKDKKQLEFFDFIFKTNDYLLKHSMNRVKVLSEEGHKVLIKESLDFM